MNYKFVLSLIVGLFVLVGGVFAYDIGYVVDGSADGVIIDLVEELGYTYEVIDGDDVSGVDFSNYGMILIGDGRFLDYEDIPVGDVKSLIVNGKSSYLDEWGIADYANSPDSNEYEYGNILSHEITEGMSGSIKLYDDKDADVYVLPDRSSERAPDLEKVVIRNTGGDTTIGVLEEGGELYGGDITDEKIVFFGITESDYWTNETKDLFTNSIEWLIGVVVGVDNDGDGHDSIATGGDDCDDDDDNVYPGATELDKNCVNDIPVLTTKLLEEIVWEKDGSIALDLDEYFMDPDGDNLTYFYTQPLNNEIVISILDNVATFSSLIDWIGEDEINLMAEDGDGESVLINGIDLKILEEVMDELSITSYSPDMDSVRILVGDSQEFSVVVSDQSADVNWFIDDLLAGNGFSYDFIDDSGNYNLKAVASKTGFDDVERVWDVFFGVIGDFTCSEIGGDICTSDEICSEDFLGVSDSSVCCPASCSEKPLEFNDIDRETITGDIEVEIKNPDINEEFTLGEVIRLKLDIDNNVDEDLDIDVKVYLYDLTEDEVVENYDYTTEVNENSGRILNVELRTPYDLPEENDYALFVQINDEDEEYFNEDYVRINLDRENYKVVIDKIEFVDQVSCGNYLNVKVKVRNMGSDDVMTYFKIENSVLKINERTEDFELEAYEGKDSMTKTFRFKIPDEVEKEIYGIKVSTYFEGKRFIDTKNIVVDCVGSEMNVDTIDVVSLGG